MSWWPIACRQGFIWLVEGFKINQQDLRVGRFSAKFRSPVSSEISEDMATLDQHSCKATARAEWSGGHSGEAGTTVLTTLISTPMVSAASDQWPLLLGPVGI